jgi:hypothetical protein
MFDWRDFSDFRKFNYGGHLRHRHDGNLDRATALHWLLHNRHGAALLRRMNRPADEVADLLVRAAAAHATKKRNEVSNMQKIDDTLREVGEAGFTKMIQKYADTVRQPGETSAQAFNRVFSEDSPQGVAIRKCWQVSKQGAEPDVDDERDDDDDDDALDELERIAAEVRRCNPNLTKAQAFTKAYTDPANAKLAQRERRANRPRAV